MPNTSYFTTITKDCTYKRLKQEEIYIKSNRSFPQHIYNLTNFPNTIITADVNGHLSLWYLPTKDHRGELIEGILLNTNHITLRTNTPTHLLPNQTQQPTLQDIITASDLFGWTSWKTIYSLTYDFLLLLTTLIIHHDDKLFIIKKRSKKHKLHSLTYAYL